MHDEEDRKENDVIRQKELESLGYKIIRFKNNEVFNSIDKVLDKIKSYLENN